MTPGRVGLVLFSFVTNSAASYVLPPPRTLSTTSKTTELLVPLAEGLEIVLIEADTSEQTRLVDEALASDEPPGGRIDDPYGVVLWPAAQAVAAAMVGAEHLENEHVLELGCGTGLVALAAAACGASVTATDYRDEPLALLHESATRTAAHLGRTLDVTTAIFDIKDEASALPAASYVVAADCLYMQSTSIALAQRCAEALRKPECKAVYVGDLGRPGRGAFTDELVRCGVRPAAAAFVPTESWTAGAPRHELVASTPASASASQADAASDAVEPCAVLVGLMRLIPADLTSLNDA